MSRYAPKYKWNVKVFNLSTNKSSLFNYDGFATKREAEVVAEKLNNISNKYYAKVIR